MVPGTCRRGRWRSSHTSTRASRTATISGFRPQARTGQRWRSRWLCPSRRTSRHRDCLRTLLVVASETRIRLEDRAVLDADAPRRELDELPAGLVVKIAGEVLG